MPIPCNYDNTINSLCCHPRYGDQKEVSVPLEKIHVNGHYPSFRLVDAGFYPDATAWKHEFPSVGVVEVIKTADRAERLRLTAFGDKSSAMTPESLTTASVA
jgi:hypothetical protein